VKVHGYSPNDYRDRWCIPRGGALAGLATRAILSRQITEIREQGIINNEHLPDAAKNIDYSMRSKNSQVSVLAHESWLADNRIEPDGGRSDGRDTDRARAYQRAYRSLREGNHKPMSDYMAMNNMLHGYSWNIMRSTA
jgi:hypothetical protein